MEDNFNEVWGRVVSSNNADNTYANSMTADNNPRAADMNGSGSLYRPSGAYATDTFDLKSTLEDFYRGRDRGFGLL